MNTPFRETRNSDKNLSDFEDKLQRLYLKLSFMLGKTLLRHERYMNSKAC